MSQKKKRWPHSRWTAAKRMVMLYREEREGDDGDEAVLFAMRMIAADLLEYLGVERTRIDEVLCDTDESYKVSKPPDTRVIPRPPWRQRDDPGC